MADETVDFRAQVLPLLTDHCFACHGPDENERKAKLRLDLAQGAMVEARSGKAAIVPGRPDESELVRRILSADPDEVMPPPEFKKPVSEDDKEILRRWIAQGAEYRKHWAYEPPQRPNLASIARRNWPENPIDRFILARLEREGLRPSTEADRYTLIRRVTLDLTGLPPGIAEVEAFIHDDRPGAYERVVDRLLGSASYGEHMARHWLDLARYADSNGYHVDTPRHIWGYREWVISAFNGNMPFDRFTIEQIAGDLLPDASLEQKIATGFHRNTMFNEEGGIDEEEFRTKAVVDRVSTTMTVWMGATMMCAECHTHKYDPLTQKEFYQLYAFFNNVPETGGGHTKKPVPLVSLPMPPDVQAQLGLLRKQLDELKAQPKPQTKEEAEGLAQRIKTVEAQIAAMEIRFTSMVMEEMDSPRPTHIHIRGNFLDKGEPVEPGVPAVFHPLKVEGAERPNRLDLARWLVSRDNPLAARVTVNRYWQMLFGAGLVRTAEEFGIRGEPPTHPQLLDWLATELIRTEWDVKRMTKLMVTSATYRQASVVTPELLGEDPENRFLARGPRFRLEAETLRDMALAVSGLLDRRIGGPSVYPHQPAGLWDEKGLGTWPTSSGTDLYRRGLYTYWRRSVPYPTFATFDAPGREYCIVSRPRTNTPLQALVTLNDPQFVEAARMLAQRVIREGGSSDSQRITFAFRLCAARPPEPQEHDLLLKTYREALGYYQENQSEARQMARGDQVPAPSDLDELQVAAWAVVANVLLNTDETLNRN